MFCSAGRTLLLRRWESGNPAAVAGFPSAVGTPFSRGFHGASFPPPCAAANAAGVRYPKLLCGRSSLYSSLHAAIFARASNKFPNQLVFKHSSRSFPWKLSTCAFCTGRPGSVRALTNLTGAVTDTYDYDAFGNIVHSTGSTPNVYLYSGEQFDPDLHLYYNRARYLNVATGRFLTRDFFEGNSRRPLSLHAYLYGNADPVDRKDPVGREADLATETEVAGLEEKVESQPIQQVGVRVIEEIKLGSEAAEAVAEAPQTFSVLTRAIAFLLVGTVAVSSLRVAGSQDLPDEEIAKSQNYDIYRFGNAAGPATLRNGIDFDLNDRGLVSPQNPSIGFGKYKGASAWRNAYTAGATGVFFRIPIFAVQNPLFNLDVVEDGEDVMPGSSFPVGHHTIYPTREMSYTEFDTQVKALGWVRSGKL